MRTSGSFLQRTTGAAGFVASAWAALLAAVWAVAACGVAHAVAAVDSSALSGAAAATASPASNPGALPTPEALERLQRRCRSGTVRVSLGREVYQIRRVRFAADGISFAPADQRSVEYVTAGHRFMRPPPTPSPIAWHRIVTIEARRSWIWPGAVAGLAAGLLVVTRSSSLDTPAGSIITVSAGFGCAVMGAGVGAAASHWTRVRSYSGSQP